MPRGVEDEPQAQVLGLDIMSENTVLKCFPVMTSSSDTSDGQLCSSEEQYSRDCNRERRVTKKYVRALRPMKGLDQYIAIIACSTVRTRTRDLDQLHALSSSFAYQRTASGARLKMPSIS